MPEDYCCLMSHCWAEEPNDRPTASVVAHCLQLMIAERLKLLERDEVQPAGSASDGEAESAAAAGMVEAARARRRSLEGPKGRAAAAAAVAAAAAAVEQVVDAAGGTSPV
jgi:hypothetical protein